MPKSKAPVVLQAAEQYRRAEQKLVECQRALKKAQTARDEAESAYFALVDAALAARRRASAPSGQDVHASQPA